MDLKTLGYSCEGIRGIWERESCKKKGILGPQVQCEPAFSCICQKKMSEISGHVNRIIESGSKRMVVLLYPQLN